MACGSRQQAERQQAERQQAAEQRCGVVCCVLAIFSIFIKKWGAGIKNSNLTLDPRSIHSGKDFFFFVDVPYGLFFLRKTFSESIFKSSFYQNTPEIVCRGSSKKRIFELVVFSFLITTVSMRMASLVFVHSDRLFFAPIKNTPIVFLSKYCGVWGLLNFRMKSTVWPKNSFTSLIFCNILCFRIKISKSV